MATKGQQDVANYLQTIKSRSPSDYIPAGGNLEALIYADPRLQGQQNEDGSYSGYGQRIINENRQLLGQANGQSLLGQNYQNADIDATQKSLDFWNAHPSGTDDSFMDTFMEKVFPAIVGMYVGGSAAGLFGGGAEAGALGTAAADAGAGLGFGGDIAAGGLGAAGADAASTAGLGSMIGIEGGAPAVVSVGAPAAAGASSGLGGIAAGGTALGGLGSMIGTEGGTPAVVNVGPPTPNTTPPIDTGLGASMGGAILGSTLPVNSDALQTLPSVTQGDLPTSVTPPVLSPIPVGALPGLEPGSVAQGSAAGGTGLPSGLGNLGNLGGLLGGLGNLIGANRDRITNQQDQDYWQGLMDKMMGMYQPGTPEANLMQQQMDAKDAAAGRNSQYGTRAVNLAGMLADKRMSAMTSPTFYKMGEAARGHYDNSLNSLFSTLGNYSGSSGSNGSLSTLLGLGQSLFGGGTSSGTVASSGAYANNNWLTS